MTQPLGLPADASGSASANVGANPTSAPVAPVTESHGLQRGVWAAPPWAFYAAAAMVVVVASLYAARRLGVLRSRRK